MQLLHRNISTEDARRSAAVGANVAFDSIKLTLLEAQWLGPDSVADAALQLEVEWTTGYELVGEHSVRVYFRPVVKLFGPNSELWMELRVGFRLLYSILTTPPPEDMADELFGSFSSVNGPLNAWPYLRELIDSTTRRMELPDVFLPLFRVKPSRADDEVEQD